MDMGTPEGSLIYSNHLLSSYYVPGIVLGTRYIVEMKQTWFLTL